MTYEERVQEITNLLRHAAADAENARRRARRYSGYARAHHLERARTYDIRIADLMQDLLGVEYEQSMKT